MRVYFFLWKYLSCAGLFITVYLLNIDIHKTWIIENKNETKEGKRSYWRILQHILHSFYFLFCSICLPCALIPYCLLIRYKEYARTGDWKVLVIDKRFTSTLDYLISKQYEIIIQGRRFSKKNLNKLMRKSCHNPSIDISVKLGNLRQIYNILVAVSWNCSCKINFRAP